MSQSTRKRRLLTAVGSGGSVRIVSGLPPAARRVRVSPVLSSEAKRRLKWFDYAKTHTPTETCRHFDIARSTFYKWKGRYAANDLTTLEDRSSRPRRCRGRQWTPAQAAAVRQVRAAHPRWGKAKITVVLARDGVQLSASTVGRILVSLKARRLLVEPPRKRAYPHARHPRPYATRRPKGAPIAAAPGDLVQLDTVQLRPVANVVRYQFTAIDVVSRFSVVGVHTVATATTATAFLATLMARFPFPVRTIQVDGGSEWMAGFEEACQERGVALWVLPPRKPQWNGCVERANRTGREEFWECYDGELDVPTMTEALQAWECEYNTVRPHQSLGMRTPTEFLAGHLSATS